VPNPFDEKTVINICSKTNINLDLLIYDISGRKIFEMPIDKEKESIELNASDFSPGCYFYSVASDDKTITKKMIVQ
jgi:hypothetical protein